MDPNTTLEEIRTKIRMAEDSSPDDETAASFYAEAAEAFTNLDGWLQRSGFLPTDWKPQPSEDAYTYAVGTTWKQENGGGTDVDTSFHDRAECEARVAYWQRSGGPQGAGMAADVYLVRKLKSDWERVS